MTDERDFIHDMTNIYISFQWKIHSIGSKKNALSQNISRNNIHKSSRTLSDLKERERKKKKKSISEIMNMYPTSEDPH